MGWLGLWLVVEALRPVVAVMTLQCWVHEGFLVFVHAEVQTSEHRLMYQV